MSTALTHRTPIAPATAPAPNPRRWYTLAVLCLSLLVIVVDTTIVNVAIPTFAATLHAGPTALAWIVDAYTLVFAALLLPAGSLGDRYGRHHALTVGMAVLGAGSLAAALCDTATGLIAARAVMGIGAALIMPATMALLVAVFPDPTERTKAIGFWSAVSGLGVAIGPTAGGWLLAHYSWNAIFAVNLPLIALALTAGRFLVPASTSPYRTRLDPVGAVLSVAGFGALTYTLIQAGDSGWASIPTGLRALLAAALLAAFAYTQTHSDHPMLDLTLFRNARFTAASVAIMVLFFGLGGLSFVLTQIYQFVLGYTPLQAGLRSLPTALALAAATPIGTKLATRFGTRTTITAGLLTAAAGLIGFATALGGTGYPHYVIAASIISIGIGLTMAPATDSIMSSLPPAKTGIGSAVNNTTRNLGTVLGVALVGSITATTYTHTMGHRPGAHSIAAATALAHHLAPAAAHTLHDHAAGAFIHGANLAILTTAVVILATAALIHRALPGRR